MVPTAGGRPALPLARCGNSLTVAATLEGAKQAVQLMGHEDLATGTAMVIGATGSIGAVCARLLAQAIGDVVLVSIEPDRPDALRMQIERETPGARVVTALVPDEHVGDCDLVVTATSAFGERILDISRCKPGAVICDVDFGYDIGLPPGTAYACLGETALLAMEGRFEDYTIGRQLTMEKVKEIHRLFRKHGFRLAGLRSFEQDVDDEEVARRRAEADRLRRDPDLFATVQQRAAEELARIPVRAKGVPASGASRWDDLVLGAGSAVIGTAMRGVQYLRR